MNLVSKLILYTLYIGILLILVLFIREFANYGLNPLENLDIIAIFLILIFYSFIIKIYLKGDYSYFDNEIERLKKRK